MTLSTTSPGDEREVLRNLIAATDYLAAAMLSGDPDKIRFARDKVWQFVDEGKAALSSSTVQQVGAEPSQGGSATAKITPENPVECTTCGALVVGVAPAADKCQACNGRGGTVNGGPCAECYGQGTYSGARDFVNDEPKLSVGQIKFILQNVPDIGDKLAREWTIAREVERAVLSTKGPQ